MNCPRDEHLLLDCRVCGRRLCAACHTVACPHPLTREAMEKYYPVPDPVVEEVSDLSHLSTKTTELDIGRVDGGQNGYH